MGEYDCLACDLCGCLHSISAHKVGDKCKDNCEDLPEKKIGKLVFEKVIVNEVWIFPNGNVAVVDSKGRQIPSLQGALSQNIKWNYRKIKEELK